LACGLYPNTTFLVLSGSVASILQYKKALSLTSGLLTYSVATVSRSPTKS
jgi:hypothetical protein